MLGTNTSTGKSDLREQASFKQEVGELQRSAADTLDMIQKIRMQRDSDKLSDIGTRNSTGIRSQGNSQSAPIFLNTQKTGQVHQSPKAEQHKKHNFGYRSTARQLVEALDTVVLYFQNMQQRGQASKKELDPMSTKFQPIPQNKTVVNTANPSPTGPKRY